MSRSTLISWASPTESNTWDEALGYIMSHDGVWQTTADEIAEHYIANNYDQAVAHAEQFNK